MGRFTLAAVCSALALLSSCSSPETAGPDTQRLTAHVEERLPFDDTSFTQGLEVADDGTIYVGTGQEGESRLYTRTPEGDELQSTDLDPEFFGEGITRAGDRVWQLTWKKGVAFARDAVTLEETGRAEYSGEGWGLCDQGDRLVMSDGSHTLTFRDPETFEETGSVDVVVGDVLVGAGAQAPALAGEVRPAGFFQRRGVALDCGAVLPG